MKGGGDYTKLSPVKRLGTAEKDGQSHRSRLRELATDFDRYLTPGGTALYDTMMAAFDYMHDTYVPGDDNAIILLSDGANEDSRSATLNQLIDEITKRNAGREKVNIYAAGLGPDADYDALRAIANASGGKSYRIDTAGQGETALLDGLRRSRALASIG
jgi:Mg-chelatase subunit ChlD